MLTASLRCWGRYLDAVARAEIDRPGDDGPFDLTKRVHRGQESSGIGTRFGLAVLMPGQGLRGVEGVGREVDGHRVGAVDDGDQRVDVASRLRCGRRERCG
jgi:hypothetical protein